MIICYLAKELTEYSWSASFISPNLDTVKNVSTNFGWIKFLLPPSDIENMLAKTIANNGFGIRGLYQVYGYPYYKNFYSREYSEISKRPKLTIVYDMPEYINVFAPATSKKIRPTEFNEIMWHSNSTENLTIELLKGGVVVDVIAENVSTSPYTWKINQHKYLSGIDYSVRISSSTKSSSNEPLFEIVDFLPHLTVIGGTGSGTYSKDKVVSISGTNSDTYLYEFSNWSGDTKYILDINSEATTLAMSDTDIVVESNYTRAPINIPGKIEEIAFFDTTGHWLFINGYIRGLGEVPGALFYDVSVNKSGCYAIKPKDCVMKDKCDSIFYNFTNVDRNDHFSHAQMDPKSFNNWTPMISTIDTIFLKKGECTYKINFDVYPEYSTLCYSRLYNINFVLLEEGPVLIVENGTGDGIYSDGDVVTVTAVTPTNGGTFCRWVSESRLAIADSNSATTTVTMGSGDCIVTAVYESANDIFNEINSITKQKISIDIKYGNLNISLNSKSNTSSFGLRIFNIMGKLVCSKNNGGTNTYSIPLTDFSKGIYLLEINYNGKVFNKKLTFFK